MTNTKILLQENFKNGKLSETWSWLRENSNHWRLSNAGLEIRVEPGLADSVVNALMISAPDRTTEKYSIEVSVSNISPPIQQYEQVGITWYIDDRPVFKLVKELIDGELFIIPGKCPIPDTTVHLRLIVDANSWEAAYKIKEEDEFIRADQGELPSQGRDHISLQCYNGPETEEHWVRFENLRVTQCD